MNPLSVRLKDINEAGIHQLNCTVDELRAAARQAEFALFEMDLADVQSKGEFLAAFAQAINAPDWFGMNWDAMADALDDFSWQPAAGYILLLHHSTGQQILSALDHSEADYNTMNEIFADTVDFWKTQNKPFWIFFC